MADIVNSHNRRIYSLDVLRIVAALCLLLYHYQQVFEFRVTGIFNLTGIFSGSYVVEFFFILSGFLAFNDIKKLKGRTVSFSEYIKKKYKRLIPVIIFPCLAYTVTAYIYRSLLGNGGWTFNTLVDIPGTLAAMLGIQFWGIINTNFVNYPLWYVDVLLFCYILMAIIVKVSEKLKINCLYGFILTVFLGMYLWNIDSAIPFLNMHMARGYYAFFGGILFAFVYEALDKERINSLLTPLICITLSVLSIILTVNKYDWFLDNNVYVYTFIAFPLLILAFMDSRIQKIFNHKWIGYVGELTYDIYAWHLVVYFIIALITRLIFESNVFGTYKVMFACAGAAVIMGIISKHVIDKLAYWIIGKLKLLFK